MSESVASVVWLRALGSYPVRCGSSTSWVFWLCTSRLAPIHPRSEPGHVCPAASVGPASVSPPAARRHHSPRFSGGGFSTSQPGSESSTSSVASNTQMSRPMMVLARFLGVVSSSPASISTSRDSGGASAMTGVENGSGSCVDLTPRPDAASMLHNWPGGHLRPHRHRFRQGSCTLRLIIFFGLHSALLQDPFDSSSAFGIVYASSR